MKKNKYQKQQIKKKFGIAVGPIKEDPNDIIENILEISKKKNEGRDIVINDQKISPDNTFIVFSVNTVEESLIINNLNGTISNNNHQLSISSIDINTWEKTREIIQTNFSNMIYDSETLNLSNLPELGVTCDLTKRYNTSFVLFYSSILCKQEQIQVKKLVFKENNIKDMEGFYPISFYFPNLEEIIIPTNVEINEIFKNEYKIIQDDSSDYLMGQENYWDKIGLPIISYPNTFLTDPDLTERAVHYELQMYQPIKLNPSFKGNSLIIEFYKCAWHDIESISKFYVTDAVFSITVIFHSPNSPLCFYDKFSRNLLSSNNPNNYIVGKDNIILAQKELFGKHFYAYVTAINEMVIQPQYICIVTHGVFQLNDDVMGFDRTMNVAFDETQIAIINDHIFIRNPEKIEDD